MRCLFRLSKHVPCLFLNRNMFSPMASVAKRFQFWCLQVGLRCKWWTVAMAIISLMLTFYLIFSETFSSHNVENADSAISSHVTGDPSVDWASYQYAIVLDCGSSGSRVFIYYWPEHSGIRGELLDIKQMKKPDGHSAVMKLEPGLSSFPSEPSKATEQVVKLLDFAKDYIPVQCHQDTFVIVMATAGMRMLKEIDQEKIISDIKLNVPLQTPFRLDTVEVITGKWEGIYAWIAINAALGRLGKSSDKFDVSKSTLGLDVAETVGIIDMGGGSIQIAFELDKIDHPPPNVMATFGLGPTDDDESLNYRLYVATYLGLGANSALKAHFEALMVDKYNWLLAAKQNGSKFTTPHSRTLVDSLVDPCYPSGYSEAVNMTAPNDDGKLQPVVVNGSGQFATCENNLQVLLATLSSETNHAMTSCGLFCSPLSGLDPKIAVATKPPHSMQRKKFYGFSEFWYTMEDCLHLGGPYKYETFSKEAANFCANEWQQVVNDYTKPQYSKADYARITTQCFKSAWVAAILHSGFLFGKESPNFASVQDINGSEVHWTMGALLHKKRALPLRQIQMLDGGLLRHSVKGGGLNANAIVPSSVSSFYLIPLPQITFFFCGAVVLFAVMYYCYKLRSSTNGYRRRDEQFDQSNMNLLGHEESHDSFNAEAVTPNSRVSWSKQVSESTQTSLDGPKNRMMTSQSVGSRMHHLA